MGREVRMVPSDWQHPTDKDTAHYKPLHGRSWAVEAKEWDEERAKWERGEFPDYVDQESKALQYDMWAGQRPYSADYMPDWPTEQRTHFMMYEDTSEGTPISPAFATPEELAQWLTDNGASSFGRDTATYEQWLRVARGGWAPSMIVENGVIKSGVAVI